MSQYNTAKESKIKSSTAVERDNVYSHRTKKDISKKHDKIISEFFFSLALAKADGIKTDHSPNDTNVRTIDIYQVQQLINTHCHKLITHIEIIDALYDLTDPQLLQPSTVHFNSELDGKRISAMRLFYKCSGSGNEDTGIADSISETTQTFKKLNQVLKEENELGNAAIKIKQDNAVQPETETLAKELSQVDLTLHTVNQLHSPTQSEQSCQSTTVELREQQIVDRDTIRSLRSIIIDMAETLHVADPDARISMTSSDLLDLINSQNDISDNAF
ncbi:MAG: hypothetical protein ACTH7L_09390 [Psychrobacter alimentarius]